MVLGGVGVGDGGVSGCIVRGGLMGAFPPLGPLVLL
jgi:hypothetical protein